MLNRWIILLLFCISLPGKSQILDTMYFDTGWEQTTREEAHYYRLISVDTSGEFRFYVEDHYPGGMLQMSGTYKSIRPDNKDGNFVYWYEDGKKQMECFYSDNVLHGKLREWYPSGQQESLQEYSGGMLNGEFSKWREDGSIDLRAHYYRGDKHGNFQSFYPGGQIRRDDFYENGHMLEGHCFAENGDEIEYFPYVLMPEYPGGNQKLRDFVKNELKYPSEAKRRGFEGAVLVLFTVDEEGFVKDPRVVNGDREYFNEEALRVVNKFPRWIPGEVDGYPSAIQVSVPIEFRLR